MRLRSQLNSNKILVTHQQSRARAYYRCSYACDCSFPQLFCRFIYNLQPLFANDLFCRVFSLFRTRFSSGKSEFRKYTISKKLFIDSVFTIKLGRVQSIWNWTLVITCGCPRDVIYRYHVGTWKWMRSTGNALLERSACEQPSWRVLRIATFDDERRKSLCSSVATTETAEQESVPPSWLTVGVCGWRNCEDFLVC